MDTSRQFRVLDQTLSMHTVLRDRYGRRALVVDALLLACSVGFCAAAFASDQVLALLGRSPEHVRYLLGAFSVAAFMVSVVSLTADWKGKAASHRVAAAKVSGAIASFRKRQADDGTWLPACSTELDGVYWEAMHNSVPIPENAFVRLKARHLRKVELSKMLSSNPGCPLVILRLILVCSSLKRVFGKKK